MTVHDINDINSEVASVLGVDFVEITRYMERDVIAIKKGRNFFNYFCSRCVN